MINQAQSINFTTDEKLSFVAEFFDLDRMSVTKKTQLRLYCQDAGTVACDGHCVDLSTDINNCGKCNRRIGYPSGSCNNGVPTCSGSTYCEGTGTCSNLTGDVKNCGGCGIVCALGQVCNSAQCDSKVSTTTLESCDAACSGAGMTCVGNGTAYYGSANSSPTGEGCSTVPAATNSSQSSFVSLDCTCH
jgi:hypothetical protein